MCFVLSHAFMKSQCSFHVWPMTYSTLCVKFCQLEFDTPDLYAWDYLNCSTLNSEGHCTHGLKNSPTSCENFLLQTWKQGCFAMLVAKLHY